MSLFILFESSIGYALFKLKGLDETNTSEKNVQEQITNFETFSSIANLVVIYILINRHFIHLNHQMLL
jgi:hypothetical protein